MQHTQHESPQPSSGGHSIHGMAADARIFKITGWMTGIYFLIELGLGFYSGSVSVISDAFHTFSAVGGILIALIASRISMRAADKHSTFGFQRSEIIGALLNGVFLFLMALYVLYMGYMRLQNEIDIPTGPMFLAAIGGLITEVISIGLMYKKQKDNLNMKGAFWHVMQTFVGSIIIIIAAVVIKFTGFLAIDPILGMLFGLVLLYASWKIVKDALDILLETVPRDIDLDSIRSDLMAIKGVTGVRHPHAWVLTSGKNIFTAHIQIASHTQAERILAEATELLKSKYGFYFSTLQLEKQHDEQDDAIAIDII